MAYVLRWGPGWGRGEAAVCLESALSPLSRMWPWSWEPRACPALGTWGWSCHCWGPNTGAELPQSPHRRHSDPGGASPGSQSPDWPAGTMSPGGGPLLRKHACSVRAAEPCLFSVSVGCLWSPACRDNRRARMGVLGGKRPRRRGRCRHGGEGLPSGGQRPPRSSPAFAEPVDAGKGPLLPPGGAGSLVCVYV